MTEFKIQTNHGETTIKGAIIGATKKHAKVIAWTEKQRWSNVIWLIPIKEM